MKFMPYVLSLFVAALFASPAALIAADAAMPNLVYILCDDLGYGDVHCLNPERCKIATPQMDRLASQGMIFTDAHSSSSVCTPTRYGVMTGRYNWRTHLQKGVLNGFSEPLIAADRLTVPELLKQHGYTTACIGKWHLGMGIERRKPSPVITDGPTTRGFDSYFGISASLDMPPFAFIENDRFTEPLTTTKKWQRTGPAAESFEAVDVLPTLTQKAVEFIGAQAKSGKPFFLYMPLNSPHTPIVPTKQWQGKSSLGSYGDFVMETDWAVGEVLDALDKAGVGGNTLVILTSDNGCSKAARIDQLQEKGHYPSANLRGSKADIFDGGHRIPFITLAGSREGRQSQRPNRLSHRPHGDVRGAHRREAARQRRRGQRQHPACTTRHGPCATARGRRASFHQRLLCHSPRQLEARTVRRLRRLERPKARQQRSGRSAADPTLRPRRRYRRDQECVCGKPGSRRADDESSGSDHRQRP
jgi:hypothetical protein